MGASFSSGVSSIQIAGVQGNQEAVTNTIASGAVTATGGTSDGAFNGTIGDLQKKYPEVYNKIFLEGTATQMIQKAQRDNDRYMEELKKQRNS